MSSSKTTFQPLALLLTILAAAARLLPHPPNFTPIGATALFGGSRLRGWQAYVVPLLALALTDPIRSWMEGGFPAYSWGSLVIYGCFAISVVLGRVFLRDTSSPLRIGAVALASSIQFFVITNFFVWMMSAMYPHTGAGLMECYTAAIPFFAYTVLGDLFYSAVLFGLYAWLKRYTHEADAMPLAA